MLKDKTVQVFDTELIKQGDVVVVGYVISGDDGLSEVTNTKNWLVAYVDEQSVTLVDHTNKVIVIHTDDILENRVVMNVVDTTHGLLT